MTRRKTNPDFMTGVPELLVLRLLSTRAMHGYAVVQAIKLHSGGKLTFGEGSIYPILHRLESDSMLKTKRIVVNGRDRVVYSITKKGLKRLEESHGLWRQVVQAVEAVFDGGPDEQHVVA